SYSIVVSMGKDATTGKYKYQWVSVKGTKKEAEKRLSELLHQLDTGTFLKPGKTTLAEYLERWLKEARNQGYEEGYDEGYEEARRIYSVPFPCSVCRKPLEVTDERIKEAIKGYLVRERWGHADCINRR
ncbi:unnamed protein product, partial [marine sediment metagenome]